MKFKKKIFYIIFFFLLIISCNILFFINKNKITIAHVKDYYMEDTIKKDSFLMVKKDKKPKRYQIVTFKVNGKEFTKRVIGMPNDKIEIYYRDIYYNNNKSFDYFISGSMPKVSHKKSFLLNDNLYFVIGDNRDLFDIKNLTNHPEEYFISEDSIKYIIESNISLEKEKIKGETN